MLFPRSYLDPLPPGSWTRGRDGSVHIRCPDCQFLMRYAKQHKISDKGAITPATKCSNDGCRFRASVTLGDYVKVIA